MAKKRSSLPAIVSKRDRSRLSVVVISNEARLRLTRLLRHRAHRKDDDDAGSWLVRENAIVNIANAIMGRPVYILESDAWGTYETAEFAWHQGEMQAIMRRPNTVQLLEILRDLVGEDWITVDEINEVLRDDDSDVSFDSDDRGLVTFKLSEAPRKKPAKPDQAPNMRTLFDRLDRAEQDQDWPLVLHTSASIFETLAKLVVPLESVQDQTLASFFGAFRKHASLAAPLLDVIEAIYKRRNVEPLSGHGSAKASSITRAEAIQLARLTRTLVLLERELSAESEA